MGAKFQRYGTLAVLLGFAATAQFCFLNPQPEPPADRGTGCPDCYCPYCKLDGGVTTGGGGAGGGPINPGNQDAASDARTGFDATESADARPDAGSTDGGADEDGSDDADGAADGSPDDAPPDDAHEGGAPDDAPPGDAPDDAPPGDAPDEAAPEDAHDGPPTVVDVTLDDATDGALSQ